MSQPGMADPHQFFDDTSSAPSRGYGGQPSPGGLGYPPSSSDAAFLAAPMSNMAMVYGSSLAAQGKELVDKNIDRFIPVSKLKYYFAVDTVYVGKKLGLLVFPYLHQVSSTCLVPASKQGGRTPPPWGAATTPTLSTGLGGTVPTGHPSGPPLRHQCSRPLHSRLSPPYSA